MRTRIGTLLLLITASALFLLIGAPRVATKSTELTQIQSVDIAKEEQPVFEEPEVCDPDAAILTVAQMHQAEALAEAEALIEELEFMAGGMDQGEDLYGSMVTTPDTRECRSNPSAKYDECGVSGTGNACSGRSTPSLMDDQCCDWNVDSNNKRTSCSCNTSAMGPCTDPEVCSVCMLISEASTEPHDWCKKMVLCTMRERKKWNNDENQCETNARKSGDAPWFTPDKCTCDRTAPNKSKTKGVYTNQYCECKEALCGGGTYPTYEDYLPLLDFQCPVGSPNFYNACGINPCSNGGHEITPPSGVTCKHRFFRCNL